MRNYEITTITRSTAKEAAKTEVVDIFKKHSVDVTAEEDWGQKKLWHPIKHQDYGTYTHFKVNAEQAAIEKVERDFKLNQNLLRSMIVRLNG
ncbi:ribosomal protein S6 [Leptospira fainei serovar Hurstbridge str. BUT 6]|uniref:Small ribosomal subunit protein bS6 n=1 Tax=Leptospira fainei serovar Hurstbridge str. BUT 6 TaxID=1193011 RepID=S3V064_9LEPT|nr:30S ribosomal protein S6 [Leptospira fainei]EPG76036.1 ribosomal protein S6 [Leptospira fainei serovar Hurstbridge str. BUT 6]